MFESMFPEPQRSAWYILPLQALCNLFLAWMLLSTANIVFLLPFPYRERLPTFLLFAALGFTAAGISGLLYRYRRAQCLAISGILKNTSSPGMVFHLFRFGSGFRHLHKGLSESMEHKLKPARILFATQAI